MLIEEAMPGIDDLEDVSPHCERIDWISLHITTRQAKTLRQILSTYGPDDDEHMADVGRVLVQLRSALGEI